MYQTKSREEYIAQCRYYKGEDEMPERIKDLGKEQFWNYERIWVEKHFLIEGETISQKETFFKDLIRDYKKNGLGQFSKNDGVPIALKAILFNRHAHHAEGMFTIDEFQKGYIENYLGHDFNTTKEKILYKKYI